MRSKRRTPAAELRAIAVACEVDPRTLAKALGGGDVRPMIRSRIARVLSQVGASELLEQMGAGQP